MKNIIIRYLTFIAGLFFLSAGISLIVKSALGTTPISCLNYVISINTSLSLGSATFLFNVLLIFVEFMLLRGRNSRKDTIEVLLQIPFSFLFGAFIDLNMWIFSGIVPHNYGMSLLILSSGLILQALGVVLELKPNVAIMSAEGVVKYAARRYNKDFGRMKVGFDIILVASAIITSYIFVRRIEGVREGTLIAALATGFIVTIFSRYVITRHNLRRLAAPFHLHHS